MVNLDITIRYDDKLFEAIKFCSYEYVSDDNTTFEFSVDSNEILTLSIIGETDFLTHSLAESLINLCSSVRSSSRL